MFLGKSEKGTDPLVATSLMKGRSLRDVTVVVVSVAMLLGR